jgi:hypothetical protein
MKRIAIAALAAAGLLAAVAPAQAHERRSSFSLQFHAPLHGGALYYGSPYYRWNRPYGGWYAPPSLYYMPPPVFYSPPAVITVPSQPPVYIEQARPAPAPPQAAQSFWYYCADSRAYYPYVAECPSGWQPVPAQPSR